MSLPHAIDSAAEALKEEKRWRLEQVDTRERYSRLDDGSGGCSVGVKMRLSPYFRLRSTDERCLMALWCLSDDYTEPYIDASVMPP